MTAAALGRRVTLEEDDTERVLQHLANLVRDPAFVAYLASWNYSRDVVIDAPSKLQHRSHPARLSVQVHPYAGNRRMLADFAADTAAGAEGIPDGATVDADGFRWVASFFGGEEIEPNCLDYYFDETHTQAIAAGIARCHEALGDYEKKLDELFGKEKP